MTHNTLVVLFVSAVIQYASSTTEWHYSGQNIAYKKNAYQSPGTYHEPGHLARNYPAALAVDGIVNTGSCTRTVRTRDPASWTVELGDSYRIAGIIIYNRNEVTERDRLRGFSVFGNGRSLIYDDNRSGRMQYKEQIIKIPVNKLPSYNSITVQIPGRSHGNGKSYLMLCEVQVFEVPRPACQTFSQQDLIHQNAQIFKNTGLIVDDKNTVGIIIAFSCEENYYMNGSAYIKCLPNGNYNASLPRCLATCHVPLKPSHGSLAPLQTQYVAGDEVKLKCDKGYLPSNKRSIRCVDSHRWSGTLPTCNRIQCLYPGAPQNGYYTTRQYRVIRIPKNTPMVFESIINHFCNSGYDGSDNISRVCLSDGTWSGREPKCYPITCSSPSVIAHSSYRFQNNSRYITGTVVFNTSLYIFCEQGYTLQGYHKIVCVSRNSWRNIKATCKVVTCNYPETFPHGFYAVESLQPGGYVKPKPLTTEDILEYSVQIFVRCTPGNILKSLNTSRVCLESGHWSGETPLCVPVKCKWPLQLNGGRYIPSNISSGNGLPYNTTLEAVCDPTFKLSRNYQSRRCNGTEDWNNGPAVCEPLCQLQNLTNVFIKRESPTLYEIGSTVRVSCKNGFTLSPDENITCEANHEWSGIPECLAISKPEKQESNNSAVIGGVATTILLVLLVVVVLAVFLHRRRQQMLHTKVQSPLSYADITSRHAKHDSERASITFSNSAFVAEQSHTYSNTMPLRPVIPSVESSVSLQSDREYYSFTSVNKIPKTAIRVEDLSDFVFSCGHSKEGFEIQFKSLPQGMSGPHSEAIKPQNRGKNRYKNLYAYDDTRVVLEKDNESQPDYINACYVHGFSKTRKYIAVQGPTKEILDDFWKMIWQEDCPKIVMLTKLVEEGKTKCERYWPDEGSFTYGRVTVTMKSTESFSQFLIRTFTIEKDNLHSKNVTQFHFTAWPDKGVPKYASSLVQFLAKVKSTPSEGTGPTVVHCSAGVGRTGTFIALDNLTEQGNELGYVDVAGMVASLRRQRVSMVQTLEQYIFVHHALVESLMLSTSALPAAKFPEAFKELLQVDNTKRKTKISVEFETLKSLSPMADECQYVSSKQMRNRRKNRYSNVPPVEEFMPALTSADRPKEANYINAVFLPSYKEQKAYIITQAPLKATKEDFWRLVWEHDVHTIVMMNNMLEIKASEVYWPCENERATFGNIIVMNDGGEEINKHHVLSLTIKKHAVTRYIKIFQCVGWQPHESLPASPEVIISLMEIVQVWQQQTGNHTIVVHCLNGADKSGLFCVISAVIERMKIEQDVAISQVIEEMRNAREQIIPSVEQYQFCHESVLAFMNQYDTYSNFSSY